MERHYTIPKEGLWEIAFITHTAGREIVRYCRYWSHAERGYSIYVIGKRKWRYNLTDPPLRNISARQPGLEAE